MPHYHPYLTTHLLFHLFHFLYLPFCFVFIPPSSPSFFSFTLTTLFHYLFDQFPPCYLVLFPPLPFFPSIISSSAFVLPLSFPFHTPLTPFFSPTLSHCLSHFAALLSAHLNTHLDLISLPESPTGELCFSALIGLVFLLFRVPINNLFHGWKVKGAAGLSHEKKLVSRYLNSIFDMLHTWIIWATFFRMLHEKNW